MYKGNELVLWQSNELEKNANDVYIRSSIKQALIWLGKIDIAKKCNRVRQFFFQETRTTDFWFSTVR